MTPQCLMFIILFISCGFICSELHRRLGYFRGECLAGRLLLWCAFFMFWPFFMVMYVASGN
ncbi:hypothetical protein G163CM_17670 [Pseudocitrobacter corydidari]|jgi:hypothetical protein|uniref:Uncharacterized protein n=1 Tax=Pseudocitrobacter corydidari TaxID=2891570 RepID=A0ABY3S4M7_9ENTR|nr:hypothetical protein G163CM_17670 [Pseudocitrobacter corydidari]